MNLSEFKEKAAKLDDVFDVDELCFAWLRGDTPSFSCARY